ncbi:Small integral membrane protein 20 [Holothuria leucospilota]|uniref:Small integral membrane protein 20 n=1 Tax=Holothuria leucospilota TaxID=206669 RepID=A0A9Q1BLE1_HOLLE|nr:Small integral membrane protein 20 [Holothuria leucospilota]
MSTKAKTTLLIGGFVACLGAALYPVVISPMLNPKPWKDLQKDARKNIDQTSVQPGGMRVWSDPFKPRPDK